MCLNTAAWKLIAKFTTTCAECIIIESSVEGAWGTISTEISFLVCLFVHLLLRRPEAGDTLIGKVNECRRIEEDSF